MLTELLDILATWSRFDTLIVLTAALTAMACALPGVFLLVRRQSMMGDALSHTTLPGIVIAFLFAQWLMTAGWITEESYAATRHAALFVGALAAGVISALLAEWVQKLGRVESSAALGVVFTTLFAVGLLLIRMKADAVDIDPDCVLYGTLETEVLKGFAGTQIPQAAVAGAAVLAINLILVFVFFKELRVSAFDPALATSLGINAQRMHYALMAVTAATLVSAFTSVGSILVIAMLIVPGATAHLLTDRLGKLILLSLAIAAASALLGHLLAITLPPIIFGRLGFPTVRDASTAGMMAVAAGLLFLVAMFFAPRHGLVSRMVHQAMLQLKIIGEDVLGLLYRLEEMETADEAVGSRRLIHKALGVGPIQGRLAVARLKWLAQLVTQADRYRLTESGRKTAQGLIRSHRLWESYVAKHFAVPADHLHNPAERVEHYLDPEIRKELAAELELPARDPHGREIPPEEEA